MAETTGIEEVWKIIDEFIKENRDEEHEAIQSMRGRGDSTARLKYACIKDNCLIQREFEVSLWLLCNLHCETIQLVLKDVFEYFRRQND